MNVNKFWNNRLLRAPEGETGSAAAPEPDQAPDQNAAPQEPDFSFIPEEYRPDGKPDFTKFSTHYQEVIARDSANAERAALIPEDGDYGFTADGVDFGELDLPEGFGVNLATDDPAMQPLYAEMGAMLKELGVPKEAGSKVGHLIAKYEATKYSQAFAAQKAEMASLGTPAQQNARIGDVSRKLESMLPTEQVKAVKALTTSAAGIRALEKLLQPRNLQSPPAQPPSVNLEGMTPTQRLEYANSQTKT